MKVIGLFRELVSKPKPSSTGIKELIGILKGDIKYKTLDYIRRGTGVFDVMGAERDVLNEKIVINGASSLVSDGFWIWRLDLAYYVEKYGIGLDREFLAEIENDARQPEREQNVIAKFEEILRAYNEATREFEDRALNVDTWIIRPGRF